MVSIGLDVDAAESLSYVYDIDIATGTPDPRVAHSLTLEVDDYGVPTRTCSVSYPRRGTGHDSEQTQLSIVVTETEVLHQDDKIASDDVWHIAVPIQSRSWELTDTTSGGVDWKDDSDPATIDAANDLFDAATVRAFEDGTAAASEEKRLLAHHATLYWNDALTAAESLGTMGLRRLAYESYALAFTEGAVSDLIADRYGTRVTSTELAEGGYVDLGIDLDEDTTTETNWWAASGRLAHDSSNFYVPTTHTDAFGNDTALTWDTDRLAITEVEDAAGLEVTADIDYGLMAPSKVTDPNGTETEATFDALGRVTKTAVRNGTDGDGASAHSAEFAYSTDRWSTSSLPNRVHVKLLKEHGGSDWQESYAYSDGGGRVVQTKVQAAPGDAPERDVNGDLVFSGGVLQFANADPRWVGTGRTVVDNKGNVVKQYEPFFSSLEDYEDEDEVVEWGVSIVYGYDPVGRNTLVTLPDGNTRSFTYTPWSVSAYDEEDNLSGGDHEDTPAVTHLDSLGRVYKLVETPDGTTDYETTLELDVQGNALTVTDARGNDIQVQSHDILGRPAFTGAADEGYDGSSGDGESRVLLDVSGQPIRTWRSGSLELRRTYDVLRRPLGLYVDEGSGEVLAEYSVYGDALTSSIPAHSKGRLLHSYDTAGRVTAEYDFRGRVLEQGRQVFDDITATPDWSGVESEVTTEANLDSWSSSLLESETFTVSTSYDALDRVTEQTAPDTSKTEPTYDEGGRLTAVDLYLHGSSTVTQAIVTEITYNARGQRESSTYGNNTSSTYTYDEERLWLSTLKTTRSAASSHGGATLQELTYTRDAVGNITQIEDDAQETVYFDNAQVTPDRTFTYDSLYRLTEGTGREKVAQTQTTAFYADYAGSKGAVPDAGNPALRSYTQSYVYDEAGNLTEMKHAEGATVHWKRGYDLETGNNQLKKTSLPGDTFGDPSTYSSAYSYNARGAMVFLPHLKTGVSENLTRDFRDQLRKADLNSGGDVAWYAYDAAGNRVRKFWDKGSVTEERIYIGAGWEVWRKRNGSGTLTDERETLHVMDDQRRVAMVETDTQASTTRYRFQLDDHLGTASVETDDDGGVITYEEFHPYGTTAWWARSSSTDVSAKRYRYTGKEKDEETGLSYHQARYLMTWLGRWDRPDPIELQDGPNRFGYVRGQPTGASDPTGLGAGSNPVEPDIEFEVVQFSGLSDADSAEVLEAAGFANVEFQEPDEHYRIFTAVDPEADALRVFRLYDSGVVQGSSRWDEIKDEVGLIPGSGQAAVIGVELARGGPGAFADEVIVGLALGGLAAGTSMGVRYGAALVEAEAAVYARSVGNAGRQGLSEAAAELHASPRTTGATTEAEALYGPFHRLQPKEISALVAESGELFGMETAYHPVPAVRAYTGALPEGETGLEFFTAVRPQPGTTPSKALWYEHTPGTTTGVRTVPASAGGRNAGVTDLAVIIRVKVTKVN